MFSLPTSSAVTSTPDSPRIVRFTNSIQPRGSIARTRIVDRLTAHDVVSPLLAYLRKSPNVPGNRTPPAT